MSTQRTVAEFLAKVRRRLRMAWGLAMSSLIAPAVAASAVVLVGTGRLLPWGWPEPVALMVVGAATVVLIGWTVLQPLSLTAAARAADRSLASKDAFGAVLQFGDLQDRFGDDIRARAELVARSASPAMAVPLPGGRPYRRWVLAALLGVVAVALAFASNPQDAERARRAALAEDAEELAAEVKELAEELENQISSDINLSEEDAALADLLADLETLAEELPEADSQAAVQELISEAQERIEQRRPTDFASKQAAAQGLSRSLEAEPLAGTAGSPSEQMEAAAEELAEMSEEEQEALAERLDELAETQSLGDAATAAALAEAAGQLRAGNGAAASAALGEAAAAQAANASVVAAQATAAGAASKLGELGAGAGAGAGAGEGEGGGQGEGSGSGEGQGAGQGGGQGGGSSAGGSPSGEVGGADGGNGSGQGGVGTPGGTDQARAEGANSGSSIINPAALETGEPLDLGGSITGDGQSETVGTADGATEIGGSRVPLANVVREYAARSAEASDRQRLAPSQQELVEDYFSQLTEDQ